MRFLRLLSTAVLTAIGFAALAQSSGTAALSVTVDGLRNNNGTVIVAAFAGHVLSSAQGNDAFDERAAKLVLGGLLSLENLAVSLLQPF